MGPALVQGGTLCVKCWARAPSSPMTRTWAVLTKAVRGSLAMVQLTVLSACMPQQPQQELCQQQQVPGNLLQQLQLLLLE